MKEPQMRQVAQLIDQAIEGSGESKQLKAIKLKVLELARRFPLYPELLTW
jgi:glycine/serine hydroxymethyltransferase